jgi:cytidylate kinase
MNKIVAIDGPAGSGKGTLASIVSKACNLVNIDTGATYRCVALKALRNNLKVEDKEEIIKLSENINVEFGLDGKVFLDGEDVTDLIRSKEVTKVVSPISSIVEVRKNMVELQRRLANNNDVIMEGRDITTVVFPNATYKFYLDADVESRAKRRYKENMEKGIESSFEEILENIKKRDYNDMHKEVGSLTRTEDSHYIDSTNMTIEEVVEEIKNIIEV